MPFLSIRKRRFAPRKRRFILRKRRFAPPDEKTGGLCRARLYPDWIYFPKNLLWIACTA